MIGRILFLLLGFILMSIGFAYIIVYTNLFTFGYTLKEYIFYIISRYECWYFIIGLLIEIIFIFKGEKQNVKRI